MLSAVLAAIRDLQYGYVQLILQDGKVVQIDRLERSRLRADPPRAAKGHSDGEG